MSGFRLDLEAVTAARADAAALGASADAALGLVAQARDGAALSDVDLAALFGSPHVATDELLGIARARRGTDAAHIETFSPLYLTNECDAECRMCGMRGSNDALVRETAEPTTAEAQLDILRARGIRAVALLTGEYRHGPQRRAMIERAATALRAALARGFRHVLINIGALDRDEYALLLDGVPRDDTGRVAPQVTMCTFQETYHPDVYAKFMGTTPENPRSDFARRLGNFDRAADAGMWVANPGVLLGLHDDVAWELLALLAHVRHLQSRGLGVYISLPRLRRATGTAYPVGVGDDELCRLVSVLSFGVPTAKVVVSTREPAEIQHRLLPVIGVLTPGSPGVAPYTATGARFDLEASQFEVLDHRPIEAILGDLLAAGAVIDCYEPTSPDTTGA
jgi:2-iminoacetate synthase